MVGKIFFQKICCFFGVPCFQRGFSLLPKRDLAFWGSFSSPPRLSLVPLHSFLNAAAGGILPALSAGKSPATKAAAVIQSGSRRSSAHG